MIRMNMYMAYIIHHEADDAVIQPQRGSEGPVDFIFVYTILVITRRENGSQYGWGEFL